MATLEDIVAATKILAEDSEILAGGSGSDQRDDRVRTFNVNEVDGGGGGGAAVREQITETEAGVETIFHKENGKDGRLDCKWKEKNRVECSSSVLNDGRNVSVNGNDLGMGVDGSLNDVNGREGSDDKLLKENEKKGVDMGLDGEVNGVNLEHQDHGFLVGDFVWGKIKSHPWWPGQVYDPSDASEFAMKHGQEGRILVAFFGDGSCSWCMPSQLLPFVENFERMSKDSSSTSFLDAVHRALDEIGRLVESEMSCKCIPEGIKVRLARPVVENAGVKAGVLMPEVNVNRLSLTKYEPAELLAKLRNFAVDVSAENEIELVVLRSWLSAFRRFKDGYPLPQYHEPLHIEGLEDMSENIDVIADDFSVPIAVPILGPLDDDWMSSPPAGSAKSEAYSDDKIYHRRKQKSVAELMGENTLVRPKIQKRFLDIEIEKSESDPKQQESNDGIEGGGHQRTSSARKVGRKRNVELSISPRINGKKVLISENGSVGGVSLTNEDVVGKLKNVEVSDSEITSGDAKEGSEVITTPRERKKSKYLSPPYTNLQLRFGNSRSKIVSEIESYKATKIAQVGEHMVDIAGDLFASPPVSQFVDKSYSDEKVPDGQSKKLDISINTGIVTAENDMTFSVRDTNTPVDALLSEIQFAAVDSLHLSKGGSLDMVWDFVSALRSATFIQGSNYKIYHKFETGKKRKSLSSPPRNMGNDIAKNKTKLSELKQCKEVSQKTAGKSGTSKSRKSVKTSAELINVEEVEEEAPSRLILTFTPEFPLPSKNDIVNLFRKFGSLNEKETIVVTDSHSVHIVYMKKSDAVAAFTASVSRSPFGSENVNYRLQHSSAHPVSRGSQSKVSSPLKRTPDKADRVDDLMSDVAAIKQKLEIMTAILENYHCKFLPEDKSCLKDEMKHLMGEVERASETVRIVAEKTSS